MSSVADALTLARALSVIPIALLVLSGDGGAERWAFWLFTLAALTDVADGALARRAGTASAAGAFLDPLADKVLVLGVLAALATRGALPAWLVGLVAAREAAVTVARAATAAPLPATALAKLKTATQLVAVALLLLQPGGGEIATAAQALLLASFVIGLRPAARYGARALRGSRTLLRDAA